LKILYFANIRQTIGIIEENIDIDETYTVEEVIKILKKKNEKYKKAFSNIDNIKCSINLNYVKLNAKVKNSDELAFFPPVTGG
tara:strand:- start:849 stop:1097 length:249 start_codon:yes stop_codon:yes gene_type:complete